MISSILNLLKTNWRSWGLSALKGAWTALKNAAWPAIIAAGVATTATTVTGCSALQEPRSKTQSSSVYAFGLPAVVITHDNKQVADGSGPDTNSATTYMTR